MSLLADHSTSERVLSEPSLELFSSGSFYLSHDAFNNIQSKMSWNDQGSLIGRVISAKNTFGASVTSSESLTLIDQFPLCHAIFRSSSSASMKEILQHTSFSSIGGGLSLMSGWIAPSNACIWLYKREYSMVNVSVSQTVHVTLSIRHFQRPNSLECKRAHVRNHGGLKGSK